MLARYSLYPLWENLRCLGLFFLRLSLNFSCFKYVKWLMCFSFYSTGLCTNMYVSIDLLQVLPSRNVLPDDTFITCSSDDTIRLWNMNPSCFTELNHKKPSFNYVCTYFFRALNAAMWLSKLQDLCVFFVQEHCLLAQTEDELFLMVFPTHEFSSLVANDCHPELARYLFLLIPRLSSSEHLPHVIVFHWYRLFWLWHTGVITDSVHRPESRLPLWTGVQLWQAWYLWVT